jgi:hypothetical protein
MTCVLDLEGIAPGITRGFYSLCFLLFLYAYDIAVFPSSPAPSSSPGVSTHGFFALGSTTRPSSSLTPSVVVFFAFSA